MKARNLSSGSCKTWLLYDERSKEAILVDPILTDGDKPLRECAALGLKLTRIVDTHTHADHVSGATKLASEAKVPYAMHGKSGVVTLDERLNDGSILKVGNEDIRVLHTPGHTKDSMSLIAGPYLLTGDFLFLGEGGAGRTDLLGGDPGEHWDSLQRLAGLDDQLLVLPGHDYRGQSESRLADEKRRNPRLQPRSKEAYVRWLQGFALEPAEWMLGVLKANSQGTTDASGVEIPSGACCEVQGGSAAALGSATISVEDLNRRLSDASRPRPLVLDVREPSEFSGPLGHVPGAKNLPLSQLPGRLEELRTLLSGESYVICLSGGRSARAIEFLSGQGFSQLVNVVGGTRAWVSAGLAQERA